jgi:hypothetical protein
MPDPKRPTTLRPLLSGLPDVEEGYYDLEEHERSQMWVAMQRHTDAVALWYRALTQYRRAMLEEGWHFEGAKPGTVELTSMGLRMQLLGLGVSAAKSGLDDLLAGYYSQAFGGIRHMLETFAQCLYVDLNPDESKHWYEQPGGIDAQIDPPKMKHVRQTIQAESGFAFTKVPGFMDRVYNSWHLMSKGAHPSGVGIRQTESEVETKHLIGATYNPDLCLAGFDIGLFALGTLLPQALRMTKPKIGPWSDEWARIEDEIGVWREANAAALRAAMGMDLQERRESPPRPVPQVSGDDLKRCRNLFRLHYEQMNRMRLPVEQANASEAGHEEGATKAAP